MLDETTEELLDTRRYEIGYLLVPTIAAEAVAATIETLLRGTIAAGGGQILGGGEPKLMPLAYPIRKTIDNKNLRFREAYFASLRFNITPNRIAPLDQTFRLSPLLLRFLMVELPVQVEESPRRPRTITPLPTEKVEEKLSPGIPMSQTEMDREIEGLLLPTSS
mgnify:CR=1 FL=1